MRKIYEFFNKIGVWFASFGVDRYLHLLAGLFISFLFSMLFHFTSGENPWTCVGVAMIVTSGVGMFKEVADQTYSGESSALDFGFTCLGGALGCGLWLL